MSNNAITQEEADAINSLMPGNQVYGLGDKLKYLMDQLGTDTTGIVLSGAMDNAINVAGVIAGTNTNGSVISTGSTWIVHSAVGSCALKLLCSYSGATGDYATLRIRARSDAASAVAGVVGGNFSASANINNYANLYAVQGYAQPLAFTQNSAANILCGVYSCVQRTVATSGRSWSLWTDTHETVKASAGHYLHRLSHNGGAINLDGIWTIYAGQGCDYLLNFENTNAPIVARDSDGGTATYSIQCYVNGAIRYLQLYDAA